MFYKGGGAVNYKIIMADDLTGACDTGIQLVTKGYQVSALIGISTLEKQSYLSGEILSINTETRSLKPEKAYDIIYDFVKYLENNNYGSIYKKVDSVLRGNTGVELDAMIDVKKAKAALLVPALPKNQRKIIDGKLCIGNKAGEVSGKELIEKTSKKRCEIIPLSSVRKNTQGLIKDIYSVVDNGGEILLFDSETEDDLLKIAKAVGELSEDFVIAGSAGLLSQLAEKTTSKKTEIEAGNVLVVAGTAHPITRKQLKRLRKKDNITTIACDKEDLKKWDNGGLNEESHSIKEKILDNDKSNFLITTTQILNGDVKLDDKPVDIFNEDITKGLSIIGKKVLERSNIGGLILTGGATASAFLEEISVSVIKLLEEPMPGIVLGEIDYNGDALLLATKSGGFGDSDTLEKLIDYMEEYKI